MVSQLFFIDEVTSLPDHASTGLSAVSGTSPVEEGNSATPTSSTRKPLRSSAWYDPADKMLKVGLEGVKQRQKLRNNIDEDEVSGLQYESKLRNYYTNTNPTPKWALNAQNRVQRQQKRRRFSSSSSSAELESEFSGESHLRIDNAETKAGGLPLGSGVLSIERLRDVNYSSRSQGSVHSLGFHPNPKVSVLFTAGGDRRLRLFNVRLLNKY
jgi:U3 small nucleolar RNA-associated protein 18